MFQPFNAEKAVQAIGVLLRCHRHSVATKLRILKLLYIADREGIKEIGRPVLGCRTVAMDHGPLHSAVLDLINGEHIAEPLFSKYFEKFDYFVELSRDRDPGVGRLSRFEIEKLQEVCERYAVVSDWDLAHKVTHSFPEWIDNQRPGTSATIPLEHIIAAVGRSTDQVNILKDLADEVRADELFGQHSL